MAHHLLFPKARELLSDAGYLLISDCFRKADIKYYETVWTDSEFSAKLAASNFEIVSCDDITDEALPTLDVGKKTYSEVILPTIEIIRDLAIHVTPAFIVRALKFFFRKQLALAAEFLYVKQPDQFDRVRFKEHVNYRVLLLKKV